MATVTIKNDGQIQNVSADALAASDLGTWALGIGDEFLYRVVVVGSNRHLQRVDSGITFAPKNVGGEFRILPAGTVLRVVI